MLTKRIIACLDVKDGRVVKGVQFRHDIHTLLKNTIVIDRGIHNPHVDYFRQNVLVA